MGIFVVSNRSIKSRDQRLFSQIRKIFSEKCRIVARIRRNMAELKIDKFWFLTLPDSSHRPSRIKRIYGWSRMMRIGDRAALLFRTRVKVNEANPHLCFAFILARKRGRMRGTREPRLLVSFLRVPEYQWHNGVLHSEERRSWEEKRRPMEFHAD